MALPAIIAGALGAIGTTAKGVVVGGIKNALKNAAKRHLMEISKEIAAGSAKDMVAARVKQEAKEGVQKLLTGKLSDAQALLLNRIKKKPARALYDVASKEFGISPDTIKKILKTYSPSNKASQLAKGREFAKALAEATKKKSLRALPGEVKTIRELLGKPKRIRKKIEKTVQNWTGDSLNEKVEKRLEQLQVDLNNKVYGNGRATDKNQLEVVVNTDIESFFDSNRLYTRDTLTALDVIGKRLDYDFDLGTDYYDVWVIEEGEGKSTWAVYSQKDVKKFVHDFRVDVENFLNNTSRTVKIEPTNTTEEND